MDNTKEKAHSIRMGEGSHPMRAEEKGAGDLRDRSPGVCWHASANRRPRLEGSAADIQESPADGAKDSCQQVGTFALDALREIAARAKAKG